jgi:hypothetical protein
MSGSTSKLELFIDSIDGLRFKAILGCTFILGWTILVLASTLSPIQKIVTGAAIFGYLVAIGIGELAAKFKTDRPYPSCRLEDRPA